MYDLIIRNARLRDNEEVVDIGIRDGKILCLGHISQEKSEGKEIDAGASLVISGFVNSHTHLDKADLISQMRPDQFGGTLEENRRLVRDFKKNYTIDGIKKRAGKVIQEMIRQGITAIRTQVDVDPTAKLLPLAALHELKKEYLDRVDIEICAFPQEGVLGPGAMELLEQALDEGANILGGLPLVEKTKEAQMQHIDILFEIAKRHATNLEVQIDESNNPEDFVLPYLVERTIEEDYQGKVSATHCISLSKVDDERAQRVIHRMKEAKMSIIVTPSCNLITQFPKSVDARPYNSITRVKELTESGVLVAMGTDNIRDIFYPLGNGSMTREMHVLATTTRMSGVQDLENIFDMASLNGAKVLGLDYGVSVGKQADLLVTQSPTKRGVLSGQENFPYVIKRGQIVYPPELKIDMN